MGNARWSHTEWASYAAAASARPTEDLFGQRRIHPDFDPATIDFRESRDSTLNPQATPVILALDVTGSMGMIADALARQGLGRLIERILDEKPIPDPQIMVMGVGDAACDEAPLQVSQFEADLRIAKQLTQLWLEKGGGGNDHESYTLPWYFAASRCRTDAWDRRRAKGWLFTVGDELPPEILPAQHVRRVLGDPVQRDVRSRDLLRLVRERWNVLHVVVAEGSYARSARGAVERAWGDLLGEDRLILKRHRDLPELICSTLASRTQSSATRAGGMLRALRM